MLEPDPDQRPQSAREALGSHLPGAAAKPQRAPSTPAQGQAQQAVGELGVQGSTLDALARSVPAPLAFAISLVLWVAAIVLFVLSQALLPLLSLLVAVVAGDKAAAALRSARLGSRSVQRKLFASSNRLMHASLDLVGQRRQRTLQMRSEERMRARERRARLRDEAKLTKQKMRERIRAARKARGPGGWL